MTEIQQSHEEIEVTDAHRAQAERDYDGIAEILRRAVMRKGHPAWDLPSEVWRIMVAPHRILRPRQAGIGSDTACDAPHF